MSIGRSTAKILGSVLGKGRNAARWVTTPSPRTLRSPLDRWTGTGGFKRQGAVASVMHGRPLNRFTHYDKPLRRAFHVHAPSQPGTTRSALRSASDWALYPARLSSDAASVPFSRAGRTALIAGTGATSAVSAYSGYQDTLSRVSRALEEAGASREDAESTARSAMLDQLASHTKSLPGHVWDRVRGRANPVDRLAQQTAASAALSSVGAAEISLPNRANMLKYVLREAASRVGKESTPDIPGAAAHRDYSEWIANRLEDPSAQAYLGRARGELSKVRGLDDVQTLASRHAGEARELRELAQQHGIQAAAGTAAQTVREADRIASESRALQAARQGVETTMGREAARNAARAIVEAGKQRGRLLSTEKGGQMAQTYAADLLARVLVDAARSRGREPVEAKEVKE